MKQKIYILYIVIAAILTVGCQRTHVRQVPNPEELRKLNQQALTAANVSPDSEMPMMVFAVAIGILFLAAVIIVVILYYKNREIRRKNRVLAQQIAEAVKYKEMYWKINEELRMKNEEGLARRPEGESQFAAAPLDLNTLTDEQLFNYLDEVIVREQLYLDPKFGRQALIDRFQLPKDRLGAAFSRGSVHTKLTDYIQELRLEHASHLLIQHPDLSIVQVANDCGFGSHQYFCNRFKLYYGMSPSDFREARQ